MIPIWVARGRSWGFRFLADGGYSEPLGVYERAFHGAEDDALVFRSVEVGLVLRFPDPLERLDSSGRMLAHDVILAGSHPGLASFEQAVAMVWPRLEGAYALVWDQASPPTRDEVQARLGRWEV